jgi:hypothetical protein
MASSSVFAASSALVSSMAMSSIISTASYTPLILLCVNWLGRGYVLETCLPPYRNFQW